MSYINIIIVFQLTQVVILITRYQLSERHVIIKDLDKENDNDKDNEKDLSGLFTQTSSFSTGTTLA